MVQSFRELIGVGKSSASTSDSALVIIDAQNEYADGHLKTENVEKTRANIATLVERYRANKGDIIHVVHETPEGAPVFTPDTALAQEFSELKPKDNEKVIRKKFPGSFTGTDLDEYLKGIGKDKVVLTGYMAHVCVSTTARQAAEKGYDVILAQDAIGDRNIPGATAEELVKTTMAGLGDAFGTVVQSSSIQ